MKWFKRVSIILTVGFGLLLGIVLLCNQIIIQATKGLTYDRIEEMPVHKVGLLLGTSPKLRNGRPNLYFNYRIEAAAALYFQGKVSRILVSGDNRKRNYNEPIEMQKALVAQGVPDSVIVLDYAGIRTLDSVVRAKKIFGQDRLTVISQHFHNERALYLADWQGIEAVGYNAKDVDVYAGLKTNVRELLARVKVFIDMATDKAPRHLGERIAIP